jgi:hypothetical protein
MSAHRKRSRIGHVIAGLAWLAIGACNSEPPTAATSAPAETQSAQTAQANEPAALGVAEVLSAYERVRSELAADQITATTKSSSLLETAARSAAAAGGPRQPQLQQLAASAAKLRDVPKTDANEVRKAFGDVSAVVVALASADATLQAGRHIFECPMAQGYKKWVQTSETVANPYMGSAMLECGSKSTWR